MHIIITEKDTNGRNMLSRILKMEGYEVSIAESGSHVIDLLKDTDTNIVLMNVFQCMYSPEHELGRKLTVRQADAAKTVLLVTCGGSEDGMDGFMSPEIPCGDVVFDLLSAKVKSGIMDRIQQMCSALKHSNHLSYPGKDFNWQRFALLMDLPTDAYLGCRFLR
jgi:CheY-like chemotaxis protein